MVLSQGRSAGWWQGSNPSGNSSATWLASGERAAKTSIISFKFVLSRELLTRAPGRQESEHLLGLIVGQYRRLLSITAVRAQAMCLLARVGLITPAAREAAARRAVT